MTKQVRDPVSRIRQRFELVGDSLVVDNWLEPGGALPPHYHPQQEERWSVVSGSVRFRHNAVEHLIGPEAGKIVVDRGEVHGLRDDGDDEVHLRCYVTPPLRLQEFLSRKQPRPDSRASSPSGGCRAACVAPAGPRAS